MIAGVTVDDCPCPGPFRLPALIAALIAAVSSVIPSPMAYQRYIEKPCEVVTFGTVVLNIAEYRIARRVRIECYAALVSYISQPVGGISDNIRC
jgi:hypothetical protein